MAALGSSRGGLCSRRREVARADGRWAGNGGQSWCGLHQPSRSLPLLICSAHSEQDDGAWHGQARKSAQHGLQSPSSKTRCVHTHACCSAPHSTIHNAGSWDAPTGRQLPLSLAAARSALPRSPTPHSRAAAGQHHCGGAGPNAGAGAAAARLALQHRGCRRGAGGGGGRAPRSAAAQGRQHVPRPCPREPHHWAGDLGGAWQVHGICVHASRRPLALLPLASSASAASARRSSTPHTSRGCRPPWVPASTPFATSCAATTSSQT
jgi:hypothetical protein